jgi:hypothetical protein
MERICINSPIFTRIYDQLVSAKKLSDSDFIEFEQELLKDPKKSIVIPGMDGLRKARIKSITKGKRGGFRIDYLDFPEYEILYYIVIYPKSTKEDLAPEEKKIILKMIQEIKKEVKNERNV